MIRQTTRNPRQRGERSLTGDLLREIERAQRTLDDMTSDVNEGEISEDELERALDDVKKIVEILRGL